MLKNVQSCTFFFFFLLQFHSYSNVSAYLRSLQRKKNRLEQMETKTESRRAREREREIREVMVDLK